MNLIIYIAIFIVLVVGVCMLIILPPMRKSIFDLSKVQPVLYYNLHMNKNSYNDIICEALSVIGYERPDMQINLAPQQLEWIKYPQYEHVRGDIDILPLFYGGHQWNNSYHFPKLMNLASILPGVINVFMWKFNNSSAILQHVPSPQNTHEQNIFFTKHMATEKIFRYTLALNSLSYSDQDCSLWINGKIKKLSLDDYVLWDPLQIFSLHNDTNDTNPIIFLNIDILAYNEK